MFTEEIERIQRFKLALRMGIPIFLLTAVVFFSLLIQYLDFIPYKFIILVVGLFAVSVYFQFYLIYQGFNERITDSITHTFTREYFKKLFEKRKKRDIQTLILYSIDNIYDINSRLGVKNGDKLLYTLAKLMDNFFRDKGINRPIISHYKGGDFIIMLDGELDDNRIIFDMFCAKVGNKNVDDIEVKNSGAVIDSSTSGDLDKLIDRLFELQQESYDRQQFVEDDKTDLNILEKSVLQALKEKHFSVMLQSVQMSEFNIFDISFKLIDKDGKLIHQKRFLPILTRLSYRREYELMKIKYILEKLEEFPETYFSVNIAADSLRESRFREDVKLSLKSIENPNLIFVIQEKEYYPNIRRYDMIIQEYREMGIKILIDGLGNSHTTQLYMKDLHVDMVRYDNSYGKKITDERYKNMIEGFNLMAKKMNLYTWIRMIDDEKSLSLAKEIGIDGISGNFLGKMLPIENINKEAK